MGIISGIMETWSLMRPSLRPSRTSPLFDAFGRLRVGQLETLFDSKLSYGKLPILWDEVVSANASSITTAIDTNGTLINCAALAVHMLLAVRIDPDNPDVQLLIEKLYALNTASNTSYRWVLLWNPTIAGTPNWVQVAGSPVEVWRGGSGNTMTGGTALDSGYTSRDNRQTNETTAPSVHPGMSIAGVPDILALGIESIGGTSSCSGGLAVRQLV